MIKGGEPGFLTEAGLLEINAKNWDVSENKPPHRAE